MISCQEACSSGPLPRARRRWAAACANTFQARSGCCLSIAAPKATLAALRIARAATGRDNVAKFEGGWHGVQEYLIHSYTSVGGDVARPESIPEMPGIPKALTETVITLPFNDPRAFDRIREEQAELACVVVEPVQGGAGAMNRSGLPAGAASRLRRDRRSAADGRSDHWVPLSSGLWERVLRGHRRPRDPRQGDRRRTARGSRLRPRGPHRGHSSLCRRMIRPGGAR